MVSSLYVENSTYKQRIEIRELGFIGVEDQPGIKIIGETRNAQGISVSGVVNWGADAAYASVQAKLEGEPLNLADHAVQFISAPGASWQQALATAKQRLDATWHPATITSSEEQRVITGLLDARQVFGQVYLGAYLSAGDTNSSFTAQWINGEPWLFSAWGITDGIAEPSDAANNHYLTLRNDGVKWSWNDFNPQTEMSSVQGILMERSAPAVSVRQLAPLTEFTLFIPNAAAQGNRLELSFVDGNGRALQAVYNLKNLCARRCFG